MKGPVSTGIAVYLEVGQKRTFAGAIDGPGWCRSGRDEASALQALVEYGPRYARVLDAARMEFQPPSDASDLVVIERLTGNATTDFGAPGMAPSHNAQPAGEWELQRLESLLEACWLAFLQSVSAATGKELRRGPRGGGRDLGKIVRHVLDGNSAYLSQLGWKLDLGKGAVGDEEVHQIRQAVHRALGAALRGELPKRGPHGGLRCTARYFVRRVAWHMLDHTWEIEDRLEVLA